MKKGKHGLCHFFLTLLELLLVFSLYQAVRVPASPVTETIAPRFGGVYRRVLADNPALLDPAHATDVYAYTVLNQVFDGLVQFDSQLNPVPAIAGFWEASRAGLTWTFYLKKGVLFHTGREVTAEDFVYSFRRILDPAVASPIAPLFQYIQAQAIQDGKTDQVEGLKALDPYTLQIRLKEPYAPFLSILATANAKVVPREVVENGAKQFSSHPVGTGPFRFRHWKPNEEIALQPYEAYYEGRPFLDGVLFQIGQSPAETFPLFLQGRLEETAVPSVKSEEVRQSSRYRSYRYLRMPSLNLFYIGLNTRKIPFTDPKVRQAFYYAINKETIVQQIRRGESVVAYGILPPPPGLPAFPPAVNSYSYNLDRAKQLLAEAGYPQGKGLSPLELWFGSRDQSVRQEMQAYQRDLATIGVHVQLQEASHWPLFRAKLEEGNLSLFRLGWSADIPDPDNFFFPLFHSQSKTNRMGYQNPHVDYLLAQARQETTYIKRLKLYREVENLILRDAPVIPLYHQVFEYLYQPYVRGVEVNALGAPYIPMKKIWFAETLDSQMEGKQ